MIPIKDECTNKYRVDRLFYRVGLIILFPVCIFGAWFAWGRGFQDYKELFACTFTEITGLPCPGCGGTRAFYYLFRGEILNSLRMNVTVVYGVLAYLHFMGLYIYRNYVKKDRRKEIKIEYYLYGAAIVIMGQWMIKMIIIFT